MAQQTTPHEQLCELLDEQAMSLVHSTDLPSAQLSADIRELARRLGRPHEGPAGMYELHDTRSGNFHDPQWCQLHQVAAHQFERITTIMLDEVDATIDAIQSAPAEAAPRAIATVNSLLVTSGIGDADSHRLRLADALVHRNLPQLAETVLFAIVGAYPQRYTTAALNQTGAYWRLATLHEAREDHAGARRLLETALAPLQEFTMMWPEDVQLVQHTAGRLERVALTLRDPQAAGHYRWIADNVGLWCAQWDPQR